MSRIFESGYKFEFEPGDWWIGVFSRKKQFGEKIKRDIYITIIPMCPLHIWWEKPSQTTSLGVWGKFP